MSDKTETTNVLKFPLSKEVRDRLIKQILNAFHERWMQPWQTKQ